MVVSSSWDSTASLMSLSTTDCVVGPIESGWLIINQCSRLAASVGQRVRAK